MTSNPPRPFGQKDTNEQNDSHRSLANEFSDKLERVETTFNDKLERVETTLLTAFHKGASRATRRTTVTCGD